MKKNENEEVGRNPLEYKIIIYEPTPKLVLTPTGYKIEYNLNCSLAPKKTAPNLPIQKNQKRFFLSGKEVIYHVVTFIEKIKNYIFFHFYKDCLNVIEQMKRSLQHLESSNDFPKEKWEKELEYQIKRKVLEDFYYSEGAEGLNPNYVQEFQKEIDLMEPMAEFYYDPEVSGLLNIQSSLTDLQTQIQGDLKNNSRVTFKLIQELQNQLEEFADNSKQGQDDAIAEVVSKSNKQLEKLRNVSLDIFDMLDLVYQASKQINDPRWGKEIHNAILKVLSILEQNGMVEIPVSDKLLDGKIMDVIGTIPQNDVPAEYKQYQVFAVHQRGFMEAGSGKIIRKAKVTTVL